MRYPFGEDLQGRVTVDRWTSRTLGVSSPHNIARSSRSYDRPPPSELEAVVFDLGGTLIDYLGGAPSWPEMEFPGVHALHAHLTEVGLTLEVDVFRETFIHAMNHQWRGATESVVAPPTLEGLIEDVCRDVGLSLASDVLEAAIVCYCQPIAEQAAMRDGAPELLAWLASHDVRIGLISNSLWPGDAHRGDLERFGLLKYFGATTFSSECGMWKPDPRVFDLTLDRLGAHAERAVFIGDRLLEDVRGAQRAGLKAVFLEGTIDYEDIDASRFAPDARISRLDELPRALSTLWEP
jgi:putative hydrolase of the HAD superfamily